MGTGDLLGGKYRLGQPLGRGAMGTVYAAEHEHLRRAVAVKILHSDLTLRPEQAQRFWREAELVAQLRHPNIVVAYDFGQTDDGSLYYVMERLHGETLRARLNRSPLSDGEIREVILPLLSALQAAHACGIVEIDRAGYQRHVGALTEEFRSDGDAHFPGGMVSQEPDRIERFEGRSRRYQRFFSL